MSKAKTVEVKIIQALKDKKLINDGDDFIVDKLKYNNKIGWCLIKNGEVSWLGFNGAEALRSIETVLT